MPGPPPPPPMAPMAPPPPPTFSMPKSGGGDDDRGALLKSIRQGTKLKKTVTVDKSAPLIQGKTSNIGNNNSNQSDGNNVSSSTIHSTPNGLPLGGLFAGGMPKLKPTGRLGSSSLNTSNTNINNNEPESPKVTTPSRNFSSIQDQLKKQLHNPSDTRNRGPPPPAPTRNMSLDDSKHSKPMTIRSNGSNGLHSSQTSLVANASGLHLNSSTLHRKSKSNANLSSLDCTDNVNNVGYQPSKPVINHGKPNLAPKPPVLNGKPAPPTKLIMKPNKQISRAQSMRSPRSPSPQSPTPNDASIKFGTVRNMTSLIGQSLNNSQNAHSPRPRPTIATRPTVPPPSVPAPTTPLPPIPVSTTSSSSSTERIAQPPAPSKMSAVRPPNHAPPPPPGVPGVPLPPNHAPPPPPHKTQPTPTRPSPAVPASNCSGNPPPPPPRHSSMRDQPTRRMVVDLDDKFRSCFATPDKFPRPPPYRSVLKLYSNKQVTNKQQAPLPPQQSLQPSNRLWNPTSTC